MDQDFVLEPLQCYTIVHNKLNIPKINLFYNRNMRIPVQPVLNKQNALPIIMLNKTLGNGYHKKLTNWDKSSIANWLRRNILSFST